MRKHRAWDDFNKIMVYDGDLWQPNKDTLPHLPPQKVQVCSHFIVYPYAVTNKDYVRVYDKEGRGTDYYSNWDYDKLFSEGLIFLQSTGLKDKNGKEAYAGDKIQTLVNGRWCEDVIHWSKYGWYPWACDDEYRGKDFEIIGDVHATPELMEKPKESEETE